MYLRAIVACGALSLVLSSCGGSEPLPDELLRVWRNPAPGFQDRYFELREGTLIFGTGGESFKLHSIERVESSRVGQSTAFSIGNRSDDGETVPLKLLHTPGSPAPLQIGSRPDRWIPEKDAHWLKEED